MRIFKVAAMAGLASISAAQAADLGGGSFKDGPVEVYIPNWSGLYVGGSAGLGAGQVSNEGRYSAKGGEEHFTLPSNDANGAIYGRHLGYNWQRGNVVFGLEGSMNGTSMDFQGGDYNYQSPYKTQELDWYATSTARLGYADRNMLFYGFGGLAWGKVSSLLAFSATDVEEGANNRSVSVSNQHVGWTAGLGIEYAFNDRFSARVEYSHVDLGEENYSIGDYNFTNSMDFDAVKVGASYRLGGGGAAQLK